MSTKASDREKRRAVALRQNLKRRKAAERMKTDAMAGKATPMADETSPDRLNKVQKPD